MWLKKSEIYSLIVLEAESPESRSWQDQFLLEALRENLFNDFLLISGDYQQSLSFIGL